jgi:ankyrin repeat protein
LQYLKILSIIAPVLLNTIMDKNIFDEAEIQELLAENSINLLNNFIAEYGANAVSIDKQRSLLEICTLENREDLAMHLINMPGIDLDYQDINGYSALHFAVQMNSLVLVDTLIAGKAKVNATDRYGNSPLYKSVTEKVNPAIVIRLLESGADVEQQNDFGYSPMRVINDNMPDIKQWIALNRK